MTLPTSLDALATPLASAAVRGTLLLAGALLLTTLLRRRSAASRHAVWSAAIAMQLVVLLLALAGPHWRVATPAIVAEAVVPLLAAPAAPAVATPAPDDASRVRRLAVTEVATAAPRTVEAAPVAASPAVSEPAAPRIARRTLLLALWLAGAVFVLVRLAVGTAIVASLARRGARVDDGGWLSLTQRLATTLQIDRPLTLLRGTRVGVPITWGIVYPVVLLPDDADAWPEERRRFVLLHEMAHVKRLDALTQLVGQVVLALFWFNPLVWIATRRMQLEREHACDDYVLRHGTAPTMYAEELLAMVRRLGTPEERGAQPAFAALAMARRSEFEGRMLSILDPVMDRHPLSRGRAAAAVAAALLVVVPLAALQPYRAEARPLAAAAPRQAMTRATGVVVRDTIPPEVPAVPAAPATPASRDASSASLPSLPSSPSSPSVPSAPSPVIGRPAAPSPVVGVAATPAAPAAPSAPIGMGATTASAPRPPGNPTSPTSPTSPLSPLSPISYSGVAGGGSGATPAAVSAAALRAKYDCDRAKLGRTDNNITSIHEHTDDDDASTILSYYSETTASCTQATIVGALRYAADESDVLDVPHGAHGLFRERTLAADREVVLDRVNDAMVRSYRRDGRTAAWDDDARAWFAGFLPRMLASAGLNVKPRVARWYAQGGTDRVLREIAALRSGGARRAHYEALLEQRLGDDELDRTIQQVGRDLAGSSGDMREILTRLAPRARANPRNREPVLAAIAAVPSSGDRAALVRLYGETDDRDWLVGLARVTGQIPSSGDRASILRTLTPRYLAGGDRALREAFFAAVRTIPSSGDMRSVLAGAVPYAERSDELALAVIEAARQVSSSGDRTDLLVRVARSRTLGGGVREAYLRAAGEIPSQGDRLRALEAVRDR